ncbi:hypothetical protein QFC24_005097 [Naganishia onofrii]|uniref:Uncharacterized protein n=1 Tax=Naganishia onofrii TaxID=1851511 RepID=A0ACC2XBW3_9TREE|nr:hypothetical protein QFC24_005097 [Naganishia onofrii]
MPEDAINNGESMATHGQIEAMANMASGRPQQQGAVTRHQGLSNVDGIVQTSVNHVEVSHNAANDQPMPYTGIDAGEVTAGEREMMEHINDWNATGRMHRTETHWVPIPDNMPPVPYTTPTNEVLANPVRHGEPLHIEPAHVEPIHIDEEINDDTHTNEGILAVIPNAVAADPLSRLLLVEQFREEMLQEMMQEELNRNGITQHQVCAHEHHRTQLDEAVLNDGRINGRPYLVVEHITRHDWHPATGNCIYTVGTYGGPPRGSAETLTSHYSGVPYAIWEYWGKRTRVRPNCANTYVDNFGTNNFYRAIIWPWLDDERWLNLWRSRRASRRG